MAIVAWLRSPASYWIARPPVVGDVREQLALEIAKGAWKSESDVPTDEEAQATVARLGIDVPAEAAKIRARVDADDADEVACLLCNTSRPRRKMRAGPAARGHVCVDGDGCQSRQYLALERRTSATGMWRTGSKLGRTLYVDDRCVGIVDSPELAAQLVSAVNHAAQLVAASNAPQTVVGVVRTKCRKCDVSNAHALAKHPCGKDLGRHEWEDLARVTCSCGIIHDCRVAADPRTSDAPSEEPARPGAVGWVHRHDTLCPFCGKRWGEHARFHEIGFHCSDTRKVPAVGDHVTLRARVEEVYEAGAALRVSVPGFGAVTVPASEVKRD